VASDTDEGDNMARLVAAAREAAVMLRRNSRQVEVGA
jgi:hypothetical protein